MSTSSIECLKKSDVHSGGAAFFCDGFPKIIICPEFGVGDREGTDVCFGVGEIVGDAASN